MSLGSDLTAALPELRAAAESLMLSTCTVTRAGEPVWDDAAGDYTSGTAVVYSGPCKVRFVSDGAVRESDVQGQFLTEQEPTLMLPVVGSEFVTTGDVAEVTANPLDAALVGLRLRVRGVHAQTYATARRFPCEVVSGG